jgi:hypothetical protein
MFGEWALGRGRGAEEQGAEGKEKRQRGRENGAEGKEVILYSLPCPLLLPVVRV